MAAGETEPAMQPPHSWGPQPPVFAVIALGTAAATLWLLLAVAPQDKFFAGVLVCAGVLTLIAGVLMRHRLVASAHGLRVGTVLGVKVISWGQVVAIRTATRRHLGIGSETLELDLDEDGLFVFGRIDLGASPTEVAEKLRSLRPPTGN